MSKGKINKTNFVCEEEFKTGSTIFNEKELKLFFNKKYYLYLKRLENRSLRN